MFSVEETASKTLANSREWQAAQNLEQNQSPNLYNQQLIQTSLIPAIDSLITCNSNGAWKLETKITGLGWVFQNREGAMRIKGWQREDHVSSPLLVEALAMRADLWEAHERGWQNLCLKSDANELIQVIKTEAYSKEIYGIIKHIKHLASLFSIISFEYVSRSDNVLVDALAKGALDNLTIVVP